MTPWMSCPFFATARTEPAAVSRSQISASDRGAWDGMALSVGSGVG